MNKDPSQISASLRKSPVGHEIPGGFMGPFGQQNSNVLGASPASLTAVNELQAQL